MEGSACLSSLVYDPQAVSEKSHAWYLFHVWGRCSSSGVFMSSLCHARGCDLDWVTSMPLKFPVPNRQPRPRQEVSQHK